VRKEVKRKEENVRDIMIERMNINQLLDDSVLAIKEYQTQLEGVFKSSVESDDLGDSLGELMTVLTGTSIGLKSVLKKGRASRVDFVKLKAAENAIAKLIREPTTENKINTIQFAIFGINLSLINVLREMQNLLQTVESLRNTRGKRVSHIENMENLSEE
jgi:hypothetical protein